MLKFVFFYYFFFVCKLEWGDVLYNIIYGEKNDEIFEANK